MVEYNGVWQAVSVREGTLYYCMEIGEQLMAVDNNKNGYGGRVFELTLADGSTTQIKGPWSSRPDQVRRYGNVKFVGRGEEQLDDGIILHDLSGEIGNCGCLYEYEGLFIHEYSFLCDEYGMWNIDSMKTEQLFDEEID
jgi:hypothetical protein